MLALPRSTECNKRIPKQRFYENLQITPALRKYFVDQIHSITWKNKIAPSTIAQPFEMIPEIDNMPWDLKEKDVTSKGMNWISLQERQNELYPE